jgi:uncharacterized protein (DUF2252 family)
MTKYSVTQRIELFNKGRNTEILTKKYKAMKADCFAFVRGTAHLFYEDWPQQSVLNDAPLAWICGDLHLQNFGSYKGDNRLTYFDINDFDEALLAPCTWDLARFVTSLLVAAPSLELTQAQALALSVSFLDAYALELTLGKARWIERATSTGIIKELLKSLKNRARSDLLSERTFKTRGVRKLSIDGKKLLLVSDQQKRHVGQLIDSFAETQPNPSFFKVLDVAQRVSGLSSLGLERYTILVCGKGNSREYLLDLKYQRPSSLAPYATQFNQPSWASEAERTAVLQRRGQAAAPAFLHAIIDGKQSYLLKELMPQQDRLNLGLYKGQVALLEQAIITMAELVAWLHLRTGGWNGSAIADQWQSFGQQSSWKEPLLAYALNYSEHITADWGRFKVGL